MAKILISYGDERFYESVRRICRNAKGMKYFDKVKIYTDKDLPLAIKASPCFNYRRGGGYWMWKPYIVWKTLQMSCENDVIYYVDAGCSLNTESNEWSELERLLLGKSALFFQYREDAYEVYPEWSTYIKTKESYSSSIKYWTKPATIEYFKSYFVDDSFLAYNSLWAGAFVVKNNDEGKLLVKEWFDISLFHPELIMDPLGKEQLKLPVWFNAHRHDQSILTLLVCYYKDKLNIRVIYETSESDKKNAAIRADRYIQAKMNPWLYLKYRLKSFCDEKFKKHTNY